MDQKSCPKKKVSLNFRIWKRKDMECQMQEILAYTSLVSCSVQHYKPKGTFLSSGRDFFSRSRFPRTDKYIIDNQGNSVICFNPVAR